MAIAKCLGQGGKWALGWQPHSRVVTPAPGVMLGMAMGQNVIQTGLQSLFVLLLAVQHASGQDLAGVLSALQGQAGEVLVKGDSVG